MDRTFTRRVVPGIAGVAAAVLGLAACSSTPPPDIRTAQVTLGTVTEVVQAPGSVVARATATVTSPAGGTVSAVVVKDGAKVKAGQLLLRIASPAAEAALVSAKQADARAASTGSVSVGSVNTGALDTADATAKQAFASARLAAAAIPDANLKAQALTQIASAEAQYASAQAAARAALAQTNSGLAGIGRAAQSLADAQRAQTRAALSAAQGTVDALAVRAPIAGTVVLGGVSGGSSSSSTSSLLSQLPSALQGTAQSLLGGAAGSGSSASVVGVLEVGTPVSSGTNLLTVTDVSTLTLAVSVDETDILTVKPGVTADVDFDAVPGVAYTGTVTSVDLAPTTSSRGGVAYVVRLTLDPGVTDAGSPAPEPRPGMSAVVSLNVLTAKDVVSVPAAAVFRDGKKDAVWVVEGGVAHRRDVELGAQGDATIQVATGLSTKETVVIKGADKVTEGMQVGSK